MESMVNKSGKRKIILIAMMCVLSYFAVYTARNVLSTVTPALLAVGYTEEYIGQVSSLFLVFYACGQLVNGFIGDRIKAKYMICAGLVLAGVTNFTFPYCIDNLGLAIGVYGACGFFLSMIYGPMTKFVAENVEPEYATRISVGYSFSSYAGAPVAGLFAAFLSWDQTFAVSGALLFVMTVASVLIIFSLEKKDGLVYKVKKEKNIEKKGIGVLIKRDIVRFALVAMLTGVVRTSVVFWLPTYINQFLGFSAEDSALLFTGATAIISLTVIITAFIYEKIGRDMHKMLAISFIFSTACFALTYLFHLPVANLIFIVLAIMGGNAASTILWSMYCPSLGDTGMVSTATGFLDCMSYAAAALSNVIFATASTTIGWGNLILVWCALMGVGIVVSLVRLPKKA